MFFTNGKILIEKNDNVINLSEAVGRLEAFLLKEYKKPVKFKLDESQGFPCYMVPAEVTFNEMSECLGSGNIHYRAINDDTLQTQAKSTIEVQHRFTAEELAKIAQEQSQVISEKNEVEEEKSAVMKRFSAQIKELDRQIEVSANKYLQGFETRIVDCIILFNFAEGKKYYQDMNTGEIRKVEDMKAADYAMQIKHEGFEWQESVVIEDESRMLTEGENNKSQTAIVEEGEEEFPL